eukprot:4299864-Amphidinium_carterae.1
MPLPFAEIPSHTFEIRPLASPQSLYCGGALCASEFAKELAAALRSPITGRDRHCGDPDLVCVAAPATTRLCGSTPTIPVGISQIAPTLVDTPHGA